MKIQFNSSANKGASIGRAPSRDNALSPESNVNIIQEIFNATGFDENWHQFKVEAGSSYLPKITSLTVLRSLGPNMMQGLGQMFPNSDIFPDPNTVNTDTTSLNPVAFFDEFVLDCIMEGPMGYFILPFFFPLSARLMHKTFDVKEWRLIGQPMKELEKAFQQNKPVELGRIYDDLGRKVKKEFNVKNLQLQKHDLSNVARAKLFTFVTTMILAMGFEGAVTHVKNLLTIALFKESNPYVVQGMEFHRTDEDIDKQNQFIKDRSWYYIKKCMQLTGLALGGLTIALFGKGGKSFIGGKKMRHLAKYLDGGKNFQMSRVLFSSWFLVALWSYISGSRPVYNDDNPETNNPERREMFWRIYPVVALGLFGKDLMKKVLGTRLETKINNNLQKDGHTKSSEKLELITPWKEAKERNQFMDFNVLHHDRIQKQDIFKKLPEQKREQILTQLKNFNKRQIYYPILALGLGINFYNYIVTFNKNHQSHSTQSSQTNLFDDSQNSNLSFYSTDNLTSLNNP